MNHTIITIATIAVFIVGGIIGRTVFSKQFDIYQIYYIILEVLI